MKIQGVVLFKKLKFIKITTNITAKCLQLFPMDAFEHLNQHGLIKIAGCILKYYDIINIVDINADRILWDNSRAFLLKIEQGIYLYFMKKQWHFKKKKNAQLIVKIQMQI